MEICEIYEICGSSTPKLHYEQMIIRCVDCHNKYIRKIELLTGKSWKKLMREQEPS